MLVIPQVLESSWEYCAVEAADEAWMLSHIYSGLSHSLFTTLSTRLELVPGIGATQALHSPPRFPDLLLIFTAESLL